MSKHEDQLREAFESHEGLAPDPAAVYARVQELSRSYKWRRRGIQAAGGVALSAGLIAGVANLPAILPAGPAAQNTSAGAPALALPSSAPVSTEAAFDAYYGAGYDYDDAIKLADLWHLNSDNLGQVKVAAGRRLLAGETLPFAATPNPPETEQPLDPQLEKQYAAFFGAGYTWTEAEKLAKIWKLKDPSDAKVLGGKKLLAGEKLPVKPTRANVAAALDSKRVNAFFSAGYDIDDAVRLAKIWKKKDAWGAKIEGGKRLLAGQTLPIKP